MEVPGAAFPVAPTARKIRHGDELLVFVPGGWGGTGPVADELQARIDPLGLSWSPGKSHQGSVEEGFLALRLEWRVQDGQVKIKPGAKWLDKVVTDLDEKIVEKTAEPCCSGAVLDKAVEEFLGHRRQYLKKATADTRPLERVVRQRYDWWKGMLDDIDWRDRRLHRQPGPITFHDTGHHAEPCGSAGVTP
jgi:hypothetical protein